MFPNFEVDKFSCWGRGRVSGQSWLKTLHLLTNFWCCLKIFGLLEGRGWTSPPTLLLTISLAAEYFSYIGHSRAWSHAFNFFF